MTHRLRYIDPCPAGSQPVSSVGIYGLDRHLRPSQFAYPCGHRVAVIEHDHRVELHRLPEVGNSPIP